jgi:hypothetical protein
MDKKIDQMFIDYIFNTLRAIHTESGFMFKGDEASDIADAWKDMLYQRLQEKNITDCEYIIKKTYSYKCVSKPFPEVADFILYLLDIPMPTNSWLKSVVMQIQNNERYNRHSPVKCSHRNDSAPIEHWEIAEKLAKHINDNFGKTESAEIAEKMLQDAITGSLFKINELKTTKKQEICFQEIKKIGNISVDKRNKALNEMLKKLGKR